MRTTLNIDDALLAQASSLTGISEKTALVRAGLEALVERENARRLTRLGGNATRPPENRPCIAGPATCSFSA